MAKYCKEEFLFLIKCYVCTFCQSCGMLKSAHLLYANTQVFCFSQLQPIVMVATCRFLWTSATVGHTQHIFSLYFLFHIQTKEELVKLCMHYGLSCVWAVKEVKYRKVECKQTEHLIMAVVKV